MLKRFIGRLMACAFLSLAFSAGAFAQAFDSDTISGLPARNIGSAAMSGRIAAIDAVMEKGRATVYVGSASGGVWKSSNNGTTFKPVFDKYTMSIGAVTIDPSNPKTVWVGTGEAWTRNSTSVGTGIYKTTDAGENWTDMGLKDSERISKILVDPKDSNTVYACVVGHLWNDSNDRGVYKTSDGGKTWNKILAGANPSTGCSMISMSSADSKVLYAGLWDFRRKGWTFRSGGEGPEKPSASGLWKTTDGGAHWSEITGGGLPEKPYGRIAVTVAPSKPSVVYAVIEGIKTALYRSDDDGKNWQRLDSSQLMNWRPFYFSNLIVDPKNDQKLYKVDLGLIVSTDGGKSFSGIAGAVHGDFHTVWIEPSNPDHIIVGDDGGAAVTTDGGAKWDYYANLPVSQFYHVSVDNNDPYRVYGGLQDNSSWIGWSEYPGGISNAQWENMYGGDGFWMFEDTADPNYVYAEAQGGELGRVNRKTYESRSIKPMPLPDYPYGHAYGPSQDPYRLRFNWNTPIHMSPNHKGRIYIGAQFLFQSDDHGQTWQRISPDLTTNDPEKQMQELSGGITVDNSYAEMHTTIYGISESPKNGNVIWVGTDDGNIQVTQDGGKNWTKVNGNIPDGWGNKSYWISTVEAGRYDEGTAYATLDGHTFGDMKPYIFKTTDFGKTWKALVSPQATAGDKPQIRGYAHVIKEDTVNKDLLFAGTEFGLFVSLNGGADWAQFKGGEMPNVAVRDIAIQQRDNALVLATHGRGIWIVDDLTPLRALTPEVLAKDFAFLPVKPTVERIEGSGGWNTADGDYVGNNPRDGGLITYYQKKRHIFGDFKIEVLDSSGKLLDTFTGDKRRGVAQVLWSMRMKGPIVPPAASAMFQAAFGPRVMPGDYTIKATKGKDTYTTTLHVQLDPRVTYNAADRQEQINAAMKMKDMFSDMSFLVEQIKTARTQLADRIGKLAAKDPTKAKAEKLNADSEVALKKIVATKEGGAITGEERLREHLGEVYGNVTFYDGKPADYILGRIDGLSKELKDVTADFDALMKKDLPAVNSGLQKKKLEPVTLITRADWDKKQEAASGGGKPSAEFHGMFERD
jgi:photosystem II stability/assembly factor-like uncharacterized protein